MCSSLVFAEFMQQDKWGIQVGKSKTAASAGGVKLPGCNQLCLQLDTLRCALRRIVVVAMLLPKLPGLTLHNTIDSQYDMTEITTLFLWVHAGVLSCLPLAIG